MTKRNHALIAALLVTTALPTLSHAAECKQISGSGTFVCAELQKSEVQGEYCYTPDKFAILLPTKTDSFINADPQNNRVDLEDLSPGISKNCTQRLKFAKSKLTLSKGATAGTYAMELSKNGVHRTLTLTGASTQPWLAGEDPFEPTLKFFVMLRSSPRAAANPMTIPKSLYLIAIDTSDATCALDLPVMGTTVTTNADDCSTASAKSTTGEKRGKKPTTPPLAGRLNETGVSGGGEGK